MRNVESDRVVETVGSLTVDDMIACPQKGWYVGEVLGIADVHLYWGLWNNPTLTRVVILEEADAELVT